MERIKRRWRRGWTDYKMKRTWESYNKREKGLYGEGLGSRIKEGLGRMTSRFRRVETYRLQRNGEGLRRITKKWIWVRKD